MSCKRKKHVGEKEWGAVERLLTYIFEFSHSSSNSIADWAIALARGHVYDHDAQMLESCGVRVAQKGDRQYVLRLSNAMLKQKDAHLNNSGIPFRTLLRRVGGRSCGTVRFASEPHRATEVPWKLVWKYANRYKPQIKKEPLPLSLPVFVPWVQIAYNQVMY